MSHQIKPSSNRVAVTENWKNVSYNATHHEYKFFQELIEQTLLKKEIIISDIQMKTFAQTRQISFYYYTTLHQPYASLEFLKRIIEKYLKFPVFFEIVQVSSIVQNVEILSKWVELQFKKDEKQHRLILTHIWKEYQKWYNS